jgi:peroxiredoxin
MSLKVGDIAPDFTLINIDGSKLSLHDFNNKNIVLLFFPFVNSSVCTAEMCEMQDNLKQYESLDAQVIGVSVDSHYSLKLWSNVNKLNFPLLSDFNKEVAPKYDSLYEIFAPGKYDYKGVAKRSAFVIGKNGSIKYIEICASPGEQPNYEAIKNSLK